MPWNAVPGTRAADYARLIATGFSHSDAIKMVTSSSWNPPSHIRRISICLPDDLHGHCADDVETAMTLLLRLTAEELKSFIDQSVLLCRDIAIGKARHQNMERVFGVESIVMGCGRSNSNTSVAW
ncbi:hypothetical protein B0H14DRAFT_2564776 [Mycena olivaceomarginata]|nr:hypothetical protein B0H14DRAFT_2564776 [Mycena olivaceomarginata]